MTGKRIPVSHRRALNNSLFWPALIAEFTCHQMKACPDEAASFVTRHTDAHLSGLIRFESNPVRRRALTVSTTQDLL